MYNRQPGGGPYANGLTTGSGGGGGSVSTFGGVGVGGGAGSNGATFNSNSRPSSSSHLADAGTNGYSPATVYPGALDSAAAGFGAVAAPMASSSAPLGVAAAAAAAPGTSMSAYTDMPHEEDSLGVDDEHKAGKRSASDMLGSGDAEAAAAAAAGRKARSRAKEAADKEKKTRSKAACSSCKSVKQKCEGPPFVPCRRCELYKLECKFPPGTPTVPRPPEDMLTAKDDSGMVTQKLFEISTRLQSIESALRIGKDIHASPGGASSHSYDQARRSPSPDTSDDGEATDDNASVGRAAAAAANPLHEINATIDQIQGIARPPKYPFMESNDYGAPDALRRGLLTNEECQQLFDFFFASLHPWVMMFSLDEDRDPQTVRARSPLLFHTILLLSTAYSSPFPSQLHLTLVTFTNAIIAPQLLNPQPHELNTDFLRAVDLLNLYKPTQLVSRRAEGLDTTEAMRASKVNGLASWMLQGILGRTAERLELKETVTRFARAHSASMNGTPIPRELVRDLRLYFWLLSNDVHGNVQSGRRCNMEGGQALTVTRLFSSMHLQPYDVRLAASVEMFEVARPILRSYAYERTRRIPKPDLERYNQGMRAFDETWVPTLLQQLPTDPLAMTVISPFREFITLQFNATCYTSWKSNRLYTGSSSDSDGGGGGGRPSSSGGPESRAKRLRTDGPRGLNDWEFEGLQRCVKSAEFLVFSLSEESRTPGAWRSVQWEEAERSDGWRRLVLDDQIVNQSKWGMDAINCIAYIFPLVFLAKLVNDGILTTNLALLREPVPQPAWQYTQKLPRLLELGAAFLDSVGTCEEHPSRSQAQVVRTLLETGIKTSPSKTADSAKAAHMKAATLAQDQLNASTLSPSGRTVQNAGGLPTQSSSVPQHYQSLQPLQMPQHGSVPPSVFPGANPAGLGGFQGGTNDTHSLPQLSTPTNAYPAMPMYSPSGTNMSGPPTAFMPGMNDALGSVLNDFEPLFGGETDGALWQWGFNPSTAT